MNMRSFQFIETYQERIKTLGTQNASYYYGVQNNFGVKTVKDVFDSIIQLRYPGAPHPGIL